MSDLEISMSDVRKTMSDVEISITDIENIKWTSTRTQMIYLVNQANRSPDPLHTEQSARPAAIRPLQGRVSSAATFPQVAHPAPHNG